MIKVSAKGLLFLWVGCLSFVASAAQAPIPATQLDQYLKGLETWSADFIQTVTDARGKSIEESRGRLMILRPGRFRWESAPTGAAVGAQVMVADGRNLWFYDRDLEQVTVRPMAASLSQSPAMLLTGQIDLHKAFVVKVLGKRDGLDWVGAESREARSDFKQARFAFRAGVLERMEITDKLGQLSTLRFTAVQRNKPLAPNLMRFTPPPGVDLIGAAQPLTP